jgi:integrase/recombinase XerD
LRVACQQVDIFGVSSHSFRRTALTQMSNACIPLRVIQEISGHRNLEQLQRYLEVTDNQVLEAAASLAMLSPVPRSGVELDTNQKLNILVSGEKLLIVGIFANVTILTKPMPE